MEAIGGAITYLVKVLRDINRCTMTQMMEELSERLDVSQSTLHKWRENLLRPTFSQQETLVAIGVTEAHLPIEWARAVLQAGKHPQYEAILNRFFAPPHAVRHNLPPRYDGFIARPDEAREVERRLKKRVGDSIIALVGLKGMGKSTLAREVAWHFVEQYDTLPEQARFDTIVWIAAHQYRFTLNGVQENFRSAASMEDIFAALASVLELPYARTLTEWDKQKPYLDEVLRQAGRLLLILDDEEDMHDPTVDAFLADLPATMKAIVVTQVPGAWPNPVRIEAFDDDQLDKLLRQECDAHHIDYATLFPTPADVQAFGEKTGHIPLVAWWVIAIVANYGLTLNNVLEGLDQEQQHLTAKGDLLQFLFEDFVNLCYKRNRTAYDILLVLLFYPDGATLDELAHILERPVATCRMALTMLCDFYVVRRAKDGERYLYLLPSIVRDYMPHDPLDPQARELADKAKRLIDYYIRFIAQAFAEPEATFASAFPRLQAVEHVLWGPTGILAWASSHLDIYYEQLAQIWFDYGVDQWAHQSSKWSEQIYYLDALIDAARERHDTNHLLWGLLSKAFTLTLMYRDIDKIDEVLSEAEDLCAENLAGISIPWRCRTAIMRAFDYNRQKRYAAAFATLHSIEKYIDSASQEKDVPDQDMRLAIVEYWHRKGMTAYYQTLDAGGGTFTQAQADLERAWELSRQWNFEHIELLSLNYLIDMLITTDTPRAQRLFDENVVRVKQRAEVRRMAGFTFLQARLVWEQDHDDTKARALAESAYGDFRRLNMLYEMGRVGEFITVLAEYAWNVRHDPFKAVDLSNSALRIYEDCQRTYSPSHPLLQQQAPTIDRNRTLQQRCRVAYLP